MIKYDYGFFAKGKWHKACNGSVMIKAALIAIPSGLLGCLLKYFQQRKLWDLEWFEKSMLLPGAAWGGFVSVLGFLIIFRTSAAYGRFTNGTQTISDVGVAMLEAASAIVNSMRGTKKDAKTVREFQHLTIRLFSLMHALCFTRLEKGSALSPSRLQLMEIIDLDGIDKKTWEILSKEKDHKVELCYVWLEALVTDAINGGLINIPAPLAGRIFAKLSEGYGKFDHCRRIALVPFPFPYTQATLWLLIVHWLCQPAVICAWVHEAYYDSIFLFTFLPVLMFWSLVLTSWELENPFGEEANDLDMNKLQQQFNTRLKLLLQSATLGHTPRLSSPDLTLDNTNHLVDLFGLQEDDDDDDDEDEEDEFLSFKSRSGHELTMLSR